MRISVFTQKIYQLKNLFNHFSQSINYKSYGYVMISVVLLSSLIACSPTEKNNTQPAAAINVEIALAKAMTIPQEVYSVGNLVAVNETNLSSEVAGRITKINFNSGDYVAKGKVIIQLDDVQAKAKLFSAQAALELSKATYSRYTRLAKQAAVSKQKLDQVKAEMQSNQARYNNAEELLQQTRVVAPFDGNLQNILVNEGDYIKAGENLVGFVDRMHLKVKYMLPETYLRKVRSGQLVKIFSDSFPDKVFYGSVDYIAPAINAQSGAITLEAVIYNHRDILSPGLFVRIAQVVDREKHAILVPEEAVMASLKGYSVYKIVDEKAVLVPVLIGDKTRGLVQIKKGIQVGDKVVVEGQQKLQDGSLVKIVDKID
ncbi:MAG: efflux RND transporter periplasmic adaptor subunit [Pseudomonadota bacterium]